MDNERDKILAMVEEGTITAEEANELIEALDAAGEQVEAAPETAEFAWPEMPARGEAWRRPFNFAALGAMIGSTLLLATRRSGGFLGFIHTFVLWPLTLLSSAIAAIFFFTKDSPWLHVRIQSDDDDTNFAISLPFPAKAVSQALQVARSQAPNEDVKEKIDAAAEILAEMDTSTLRDPLVIDISDEGDHVQVYLN